MSQELFYTSAPRGLKPGSRGFCTVMSTSGMAKNLADRLEALSGYRHVFPPNDPQTHLNPVVFSHLRIIVGGKPLHVLSRISAAGLDYTHRSNKFAHHVGLDANERVVAGPAALLAVPGFMELSWQGEPRILPSGRKVPQASAESGICQHWQQVTGDAGWGGVLAETASGADSRVAAIIFRPGTDTLALVAEALSLLPPSKRWDVTFSTYYTKLPPEVECQWRFVLAGSPEAKALERSPNVLAINLCYALGRAPDGSLVEAARTGVVPKPAVAERETLEKLPGKVPAPYAQPIRGIPAAQTLPALEEDSFGAFLPDQGTLLPLPPRLRRTSARQPFWAPVIATTVLIGIVVGVGVFAALQVLNSRATKEVASAAGVEKPAEAKSEPPPKAETKPPPAAQPDQPSAAHDEQGADKNKKSPDGKDVTHSGPPEQPPSSVSEKLRTYNTPTPSNTPPAPPPQTDPQYSPPKDVTPSDQPIPNATASFDLQKSIEIRQDMKASSLNDKDNAIMVGSIDHVDLHKLSIDLLGKETVLGEGYLFEIGEPDDAEDSRRFTIAVDNPKRKQFGTPPIVATVWVKGDRIEFRWKKNILDMKEAKVQAELLCNCVLCVTYESKTSFVALREAEPLEPIKVGLNGKTVLLKFLSTAPKGARLKLVVPQPPNQWSDYSVQRKSESKVELKSNDKNMPSFTLAIDTSDKALKLTCDWPLIHNPLAGQINETLVGKKKGELQEERKNVQGDLNTTPEQNLLDPTKTQELQKKRGFLQEQRNDIDEKMRALDRWSKLKNTSIPFTIFMEVGDDDQTKQWVVLAASLGANPPEPSSTK